MSHIFKVVISATLVVGFATPALSSVTFVDTTFAGANYANTLYTSGPLALISSSVGQDALSGNPSPSYKALISINLPDASGVLAVAKNTTFVYNPTVQGAITSIDFSLDRYAQFTTFNVAGSPTAFGIGTYTLRAIAEQNGVFYQSVSTFGPFNKLGGFWNPLSQAGLLASDFTQLTQANYATGGGPTGLNFSSGPITFGFAMRGGGTGNVGTLQYDLRADNFALTVNNAVPEPATWALMLVGFGGVGVAMRRHRKVMMRVPRAA